ncbi:unnamed protein product [Fusarium venenatum]|uniref:Uncharacterized protein n=2 Tax=Fusarium venenatum TaxID=56646 RepID=A0A2L2TJG3_9HYPO|nr:uncharacterized protein FVRRES_10305 [Fusarium venenatum]CEI70228.1 unnamed protein product [Fusarium venenatum]
MFPRGIVICVYSSSGDVTEVIEVDDALSEDEQAQAAESPHVAEPCTRDQGTHTIQDLPPLPPQAARNVQIAPGSGLHQAHAPTYPYMPQWPHHPMGYAPHPHMAQHPPHPHQQDPYHPQHMVYAHPHRVTHPQHMVQYPHPQMPQYPYYPMTQWSHPHMAQASHPHASPYVGPHVQYVPPPGYVPHPGNVTQAGRGHQPGQTPPRVGHAPPQPGNVPHPRRGNQPGRAQPSHAPQPGNTPQPRYVPQTGNATPQAGFPTPTPAPQSVAPTPVPESAASTPAPGSTPSTPTPQSVASTPAPESVASTPAPGPSSSRTTTTWDMGPPPKKKRGPKPKPLSERKPLRTIPIVRKENSYSKQKRKEVIMWMVHHRVSRLGEMVPPSAQDAENHFKIPRSTIAGWKLQLLGSGPIPK